MTSPSPDWFDPWLARAEHSDYFSAPDAAADVAAYLDVTRGTAAAIGRANPSADRVLLVGSGGSLACLLTAAYLLQSLSGRVVEVVPALELRWRAPRHLGPDTLVVLNSWSGKNSDVLDALDVAEQRGAPTVAIVGKPGSPLAQRCDDVIVYAGAAIYEVPILAVIDLVLAADGDSATLDAWQTAAADLPAALGAAHARGPAVSEQVTDTLGGTQHLLITGAGPFSSLALKLANVVMENDRLSAAYYDAVELRHGAVEVFDRTRPDVLVLAGSDASRPLTDRVIAFCTGNGARVGVCDGSGYGLSSPLLEPLVANVLTQWVVIRLAWARGIDDLDERVYMGGGSLSDGQWP